MIETLYKTRTPEKERSECYLLILASRPASEGKVYIFMEEHGRWDDGFERFIFEVTSISAESDLTHKEALAMYDTAKEKLAQRGFVHTFAQDYNRNKVREHQVCGPEMVRA
jgi:hypothetical protein